LTSALEMISAFRSSCAATFRHLELNCSVQSVVPCKGSVHHYQRDTRKDTGAADEGKERQKSIEASLIKIVKQDVKRPKRSADELKEATQRTKEYSRQCMHSLRQFQRDQRIRKKFRYESHLTYVPTIVRQEKDWSQLLAQNVRGNHA
jgi:hypothetical protein